MFGRILLLEGLVNWGEDDRRVDARADARSHEDQCGSLGPVVCGDFLHCHVLHLVQGPAHVSIQAHLLLVSLGKRFGFCDLYAPKYALMSFTCGRFLSLGFMFWCSGE